MADEHDPIGQTVVVKGSTKHKDDDEFDTYRLHDRSQTKGTNIVWRRNNEYKINKKSTQYGMSTLCPIRLVMRVNQ